MVNGGLQAGNPVTYSIPRGTQYLELQAQDTAGDRSALYSVRVPGWSEEVGGMAVTAVTFSEDAAQAVIAAEATGGHSIRGILVNGELLEGNPVTHAIPEGTRHLEMRAVNQEGDQSAALIRRVPGWSQIVSTISISDVAFSDHNTVVTATALATGGDTVAGIYINDVYIEGNPVVYSIPRRTETLRIQAMNSAGDLSAVVNRQVPADTSKSTLKVSIERPGWTNAKSVRIRITASDKGGIAELLASTAEDGGDWEDVSSRKYITISRDTTVYAAATNENGDTRTAEADIVCFDREAPVVSATLAGRTVNIRAEDDKSGVSSIVVNNVEFKEEAAYGGRLAYKVPDGVAKVTIHAKDRAGNLSNVVELPVTVTVSAVPNIVRPVPGTPAPTPPIAESAPPEDHALPDPEPAEKPEDDGTDSGVPPPPPGTTTDETPPPVDTQNGSKAAGALAAGLLAAGGAGAAAWYHIRKRKALPIPEIELTDVRLEYDESEFGGADDPLEEGGENVDYIDFTHKAS